MNPSPQPPGPAGPETIHQLYFAFAPAYAIGAAVQLGLFSCIAAGQRTADAIARSQNLKARGVAMLLDVVAALGLLVKNGEQYELTPLSERYLVRDSPDYVATAMEHEPPWTSWSRLVETIRTGVPYSRLQDQKEGEAFFGRLVRDLHIMNREPARRAAAALELGARFSGLKIVDVACGSGVWGIAAAEADARAEVTAQDFPAMLEITRGYLERHGVQSRYRFLPGDLKSVEFGEQQFDLALLGNIVHSEGEASSRNLFARLCRALKPEGRIAVIDMIPNDQRTGPPFPLIFGIHMLVNTGAGGTYTLAEYDRWLTGAGFTGTTTLDIGSHSPLIVAQRR